MHIFIDTNVYLTFYHYSNDDLEQLRKLLVAIKNNKINLILTEQVVDEFKRNRERKIADSLKQFKEQKIPSQFPEICRGYPQYSVIKDHLKKAEREKKDLIEILMKDIQTKNLLADELIRELFEASSKIIPTEEVLLRAKHRFDKGNPPGKDSSYGDAINWESLLSFIPSENHLYFIARDKDYLSPLDSSNFSEYLLDEWITKKNSQIKYYQTLSEYFSEHFPSIQLASDMERRFAIMKLVNSLNFSNTHTAIRTLSRFSDYSSQELQEIVEGLINNPQIYLIAEDPDVAGFVKKITLDYGKQIPPEYLKWLSLRYAKKEDTDEIDFTSAW